MLRETDERGAHAILTALALVLATVAGAAPVVADDVAALDEDTPLTSDAAKSEYATNGSVSVEVRQVDATLTIAENHEAVGLDGYRSDAGDVYLRVEYEEEIARTLRFYVPATYWEPRAVETVEPITGDGPTATFSTAENGMYTAVRVSFPDPPTSAVYEVSEVTGWALGTREWGWSVVGNVTGFSPPSLGSSTSWQYVDDSFSASNPVRFNETPDVIQYDASSNATEATWLPVPACDDPTEETLCTYETSNGTMLVTTHENPPEVRYKNQAGPLAGLRGAARELATLDEKVDDLLGGLFGSDEDDDGGN